MPMKAVNDAINARLLANWTATPIIPYDTIREPPYGVNAFLVVHYPVINGGRPTLGRKFWIEGTFRLVLNVMSGMGLDQPLIWADELGLLFRETSFDGVETFEVDGPVVADDIDAGQWIGYSVVVRFRHQYNG